MWIRRCVVRKRGTLYCMTLRQRGMVFALLVFGVFFFSTQSVLAQSCSISVSPQTGAAGSGRTLYWSASSVRELYISGVGTVYSNGCSSGYGAAMMTYMQYRTGCTPSGSGAVTVYPSSHYTYSGSASYESISCSGGNESSMGGGRSCSYSYPSTYCSYTAYAYPPASCSVSLTPNPKSYAGSATLSWSSSNAHYSLYINNVGYVGSSGSTSVSPSSSTDYSCYANGYGGSDGWHSYTLTVNPPANCTAPWGATVSHGSSVTAYQASTVPYGSSCTSQSRSCSNGTLSGTYQYQSCTVDNPPPTCALTLNPTTITSGQSSTLSWSSTNATSCTGNNFSMGGATSGSTSVSPSSNTTYTASCTGPGGSVNCTGTGSGGIGAALTVSCTPATTYSCGGTATIIETATSSACAVTVTNPYASCSSPSFCSSGSATCLYNTITGNISASPWFVPSGDTTTITWSTTNAVSCSVTGNGNTWSTTAGSQTSNPITDYTTYTLSCDDGDADTVKDDFTDSVNIFQVPNWFEM